LRLLDESGQLGCAHREADRCEVAIGRELTIDGLGHEHKERPVRRAHVPPSRTSGGAALRLVPAERSLNLAEVVDLGLHLDHEQDARPMIEREEVDPARAEASSDLDLGDHLPTHALEPPRDEGDTRRVDAVALASAIREERNVKRELDTATEGLGETFQRRQIDGAR
jgi:hypothetical protein